MTDGTYFNMTSDHTDNDGYLTLINANCPALKMDELCELCSKTGKTSEASSYCKNCRIYMCYTCYTVHLLPAEQRNHQTVDLRELPEDHRDVTDELDALKHISTEILTKYKNAHEKASHFNTDTIATFKKFKRQIIEDLDKLEEGFIKQVKENNDDNSKKLQTIYMKCEPVRKEVEQHIGKIKTMNTRQLKFQLPDLLRQIKPRLDFLGMTVNEAQADMAITECKFQPNVQTMESAKSADFLGSMHKEVAEVTIPRFQKRQSVKRSPVNSGDYTYIDPASAMIRRTTDAPVKPPLPRRDSDLTKNDSLRSQDSKRYVRGPFQHSNPEDRSSAGTLSMRSEEISGGSLGSQGSNVSQGTDTLSHLSDIKIKIKDDKSTPCISGSAILDNDNLIVTDYTNKKVKWINTQQSVIQTSFKLPKGPWDVTYVRDNLVAVTIPGEKKIFLLNCRKDFSGHPSIVKDGAIGVKGYCRGLVFLNSRENFIVTFAQYKQLGGPTKIEILDFNGTVLQTMLMGKSIDPLFTNPVYITASHDQSKLYVADWSKECVTCLRPDGSKIFGYSHPLLKEPYKLVPGTHDSIYVCGVKSNNVHKLSAQCRHLGIVLAENDGLRGPISLSFCVGTSKMFIGMQESDSLKVFQVCR